MPLHRDILGGKTGEEKALSRISEAPFESFDIQKFLPPSLRIGVGPIIDTRGRGPLGATQPPEFGALRGAGVGTGDILATGIQGIGDLIRRPGGLSPTVAEAILPRLAAQSERIAQEFRGIGAQQAGAAARGNVPLSIRTALQSALDVAQARAQRGARREALSESEQLRRRDLAQTFAILDAILQFISSGRGQAIAGLGQAAEASAQRQASRQAFIGSLASGRFGGGGGTNIAGTAEVI